MRDAVHLTYCFLCMSFDSASRWGGGIVTGSLFVVYYLHIVSPLLNVAGSCRRRRYRRHRRCIQGSVGTFGVGH